MSKIIIPEAWEAQMRETNAEIALLNTRKVTALFELLEIRPAEKDLAAMLEWDLIIIWVHDHQMAAQLNRLAAYVPNLKFSVNTEQPLFAVGQATKGRRVWKER